MDSEKNKNVKRIIADAVIFFGFMLLAVGLIMFLVFNKDVFFSAGVMAVLFAITMLILPVGYVLTLKKASGGKYALYAAIVLLAAAVAMLIAIVLKSFIIDYVQPLALSTMTIIILIAAGVITLIGALLELIFRRHTVSIITCAMLIAVMLTGIIWYNTQGYGKFNDDILDNGQFLFKNGESGYATFRIPSIIALDHEVLNGKYGMTLTEDVLLASAEGRRNSSHDTGSIDLVYKTSEDGGKTWSDLKILLSYTDQIGKYGNPTPVLDSETGLVNFPYMTGTEADKYDYKTYNARFRVENNLTLTLNETPQDISFEQTDTSGGGTDGVRQHTLMIGPGKSIQLKTGERKGRIIVPASSGGYAFVMYSDDNGLTWIKGENAGTGNECEAAELDDGTLVMVIRDMTGCSTYHPEQYQRLSYSDDGGETWYEQTVDTTLRSPICMSSVAVKDGKLIMSYPDSFHTRVNLTLGVSEDGGDNWITYPVYNGAAGYSCVTVTSDNRVFVLAEIGKINYNEILYFAEIKI